MSGASGWCHEPGPTRLTAVELVIYYPREWTLEPRNLLSVRSMIFMRSI